MKNYNKLFIILIPLIQISGCYHYQWKSNSNHLIGKNFYDSTTNITRIGNLEQSKKHDSIYSIIQEPPNTRYYINWGYHPKNRCKYSLLVAPNGEIISWEFADYKTRKECYIY